MFESDGTLHVVVLLNPSPPRATLFSSASRRVSLALDPADGSDAGSTGAPQQLDQLGALYQPTSMLTIEGNQVVGATNIVAKYKVNKRSTIITRPSTRRQCRCISFSSNRTNRCFSLNDMCFVRG